jgi:molybdopterin molybdotransferase
MVSVEEAERIIFSSLFSRDHIGVSLTDSIGRVLAEPVHADRPFPPFDRVAMDGIAIAFGAYAAGARQFPVEATQAAGQPQKTLGDPARCIEVMTGAMLPNGTDTVIRYEDIHISENIASIREVVMKGQNIHREGIDAAHNEVLLNPGTKISAAEVALLASVGKSTVRVVKLPSAAVISTGDELVEVNEIPQAYQIRKSNVFAVQSAMQEMGWKSELFHFPDDRQILHTRLSELISHFDVLILSGGVSKGKFDFIPEVLEGAGIVKQFHQVNQRPGRPFWFGKSSGGKVVFALPGNPVSTFMCFYKYIRPWIFSSLGYPIEPQFAVLRTDFSFQPKLTFFLQVNVVNESGTLVATPLAGGGSGDFANLKDVTGFIELPPDRNDFKKGEFFPYIPFRT